jgi:neutral ceramidase
VKVFSCFIMNSQFFAGYAQTDFTPEPGLPLLGQMSQRLAEGARDPLQCHAMAMRQGDQTVVLVTADICMLETYLVSEIQQEWAKRSGLPEATLIVHSTHTHDAPASTSLLMEEAQPEFVDTLKEAILTSAQQAVGALEPVDVFAGCGHMEQMGWNRRAMFEDGTTKMYGHSELEGYIELEGPRDPALPVLFTRHASGEITGVLVEFATHPNAIEGANVYSADIPGAVRRHLKKILGENVAVVYLTGAAGNTAPSILDPYDASHPWRGDAGLERSGLYLAGEASKVIASTLHPMQEPILKLEHAAIDIPRRPWPESDEPTYPRSPGNPYYEKAEREWPDHLVNRNPVETRINALRIGDAVLCTNPAELFVEFGLEIQAASPAKVTFVSELTDGYVGYVPTAKAFERGGYETWCAPSSGLDASAGDQIVETTKQLLSKLF